MIAVKAADLSFPTLEIASALAYLFKTPDPAFHHKITPLWGSSKV
jgi:hypothetical protein